MSGKLVSIATTLHYCQVNTCQLPCYHFSHLFLLSCKSIKKKMTFYWSHNLFSPHSNCITLLFFPLAFLWKKFCKFSKDIIIWNLFQCISLGKWRHHPSSRSSSPGSGQVDVVNKTPGGVHNKLVHFVFLWYVCKTWLLKDCIHKNFIPNLPFHVAWYIY